MTVVELLPVHQFDPQEGNYWGYMTLNFFAPHQGYAVRDAVAEFREMVRAFHAAGIEVWLDVVYNHTCEGDETGPTYSWRGIDNSSYYLLGQDGHYQDDSGCGNTLAVRTRRARPRICAACSIGERMGVDGFRFDLASVLARDEHGQVQDRGRRDRQRDQRAGVASLICVSWPRRGTSVYTCWGEVFPGWRGDSGTGNTATMCARLSKAMPAWSAR